MFKRILISVLALACVLGTFGTAFAATFPDTTGTKYEVAVDVLTSVGLISGFPDGTFQPGKTITRAQIAKMAVVALGFESAVPAAAQQPPVFSDVAMSHWASGYIKVAADLGLIKGYPDGTYKPELPINYEEVLAVIVRLLGYEAVSVGTWPLKYLVKATELGVTRGVTFTLGSPAPRGDTAVFFYNILETDFLGQWIYGGTQAYSETGDCVLDRLGFEHGVARVEEVPTIFGTGLNDGEVYLYDARFECADGVDLSRSLGFVVSYWYDAGDVIVYANQVTPEAAIITGVIQDNSTDLTSVKVGGKVYRESRDYTFDVVYNNYPVDVWDADDFASDELIGADTRIVLDADGNIAWMQVWQYDGTAVVLGTSEKFEYVDAIEDDGGATLTTRWHLGTYDGYLLVRDGEYDGEYIALKDLEPNQVINYFEVEGYFFATVVDDTVTGTLEDIELTDIVAGKEIILTVDGEDYRVPFAALDDPYGLYSLDENASFDVIEDDYSLAGFAGEEVTLYLDKWARVYVVSGALAAAPADVFVGLVKTDFWAVEDTNPDPEIPYEVYVRVFGTDAKSHKLQFDAGSKIYYEGNAAAEYLNMDDPYTPGTGEVAMDLLSGLYMPWDAPTLVKYTVGSDGFVNTFQEIYPIDATVTDFNELDIDAPRKLVDDFRVYTATVFFDVDLGNNLGGNWFVRPWDIFKTMEEDPNEFTAYEYTAYDTHDTTLDFLVLDNAGADVDYQFGGTDTGIVVSRRFTADGPMVKILTSDGVVEYLLDEDALETFATFDESNYGSSGDDILEVDKFDVVSFGMYDGAFLDLTEPEADNTDDWSNDDYLCLTSRWINDEVLEVSQDQLIGAEVYEYIIDPDCLVFDCTGAEPVLASLDDVLGELWIQVIYLDDDDVIDVIKIIG